MKAAFYLASSGTIWSKSIAVFTHGPYSHVELVFDEWKGDFPQYMDVRQHDPGGSLCFSSAENDGGTRFKVLDLKDGHWVVVDLPWMDTTKALEWCIAHQHVKYDWRGLRGFVFPWEKPDPADLFCSESLIECAQAQQYLLELVAGKTDPNTLAVVLSKRNSGLRGPLNPVYSS